MAFSTVYFQLNADNLAMKEAYRICYQGAAYTGSQLHFGFSFDAARTYGGAAGTLADELKSMMPFTRHQRLPVRAVLRQRPPHLITPATTSAYSDQPKVDILLLGGFNTSYVSPAQTDILNKSVVSGIFQSSISTITGQPLSTQNRQSHNFNNAGGFLYYPNCGYVLGDCCAEYIEERDEIICFGGRPAENDSAMPHAQIAVLEFNQNDQGAQWLYGESQTGYPDMPHPRYSAASVLIKDLIRKGETETCDRIFIIGGRNQHGLVPEVDVFNLRYNEWELDWKGLDQGELEDIPPSLGGGGTIIIGGDCKAIDMATINQILAQSGFPT